LKKTPKEEIGEVPLIEIDEPVGMIRLEIDYDYIDELAQSIKEIGLLQPILLAVSGKRYEIVAGHCRYLAHKKAGILTIRAIIKTLTREQIVIARATENLNRKDLTPLEEAITYNDLIKKHGISVTEVAKKVGKTTTLVKRRMDILRMPSQLREAVHQKKIGISVAEELWPITDIPTLEYYMSFALDGGCTQAVARSWCKEWRDSKRRQEGGTVEGRYDLAPTEPRPVYVTCDTCSGPMVIGEEVILRICKDCYKLIKQNV